MCGWGRQGEEVKSVIQDEICFTLLTVKWVVFGVQCLLSLQWVVLTLIGLVVNLVKSVCWVNLWVSLTATSKLAYDEWETRVKCEKCSRRKRKRKRRKKHFSFDKITLISKGWQSCTMKVFQLASSNPTGVVARERWTFPSLATRDTLQHEWKLDLLVKMSVSGKKTLPTRRD